MTRTEARATLRATTPMTFYKMGQRGLTLFALLLIMATQPSQAFLNHAAAAGAVPPSAPAKAKRWWDAFHAKETSVATQLSRAAAATTVAVTTGSGTATTAVVLGQITSSAWGKYILTLVVIALFVKQILDFGKAYMNRQTVKNQKMLIEKQMELQERMLTMLIESQQPRARGRGRRAPALPSANRLALPAIAAA
jgi:hypothetical protein